MSDEAERLGLAADRIDNLISAMRLPMSPQMHVEQLRAALPDIMKELREIYVALTGENPWE